MLRRLLPALLTLATLAAPAAARAAQPDVVITRSAPAAGIGTYLYLPFEVPPGVNRIAVKVTASSSQAKIGAGLFDQRGAQFNSPGFRGIYGEEIHDFFVASDGASRGFVPGPIEPGTWTTIVPIFGAPEPTVVTATMTLSFGPQGSPPAREPVPEVVSPAAAWYRGDLHDHTTFSSDAFASHSALDPPGMVQKAKALGLDWISLTDHNISEQNDTLRSTEPAGFLALGGEEVTNWFHGHSTATGMQSGTFYDWRWRPANLPIDPAHEGRVQGYLARARADGVYTSAAHPAGAYLAWQQFPDAALDPAALPDGLEVWNGFFQPDDETSVRIWDGLLRAGRHVVANGGSDIHGEANADHLQIGIPTTIAYAAALSRQGIVAALKAGHSFVTSGPAGPELYLTATGPAGQRTFTGGTIFGATQDTAHAAVLVRGGAGNELRFLRDGSVVQTTPITADVQEVRLDQPVGAGGYLRVELRGGPTVAPGNPTGSDLGMQALTNPIFLVNGPVPPGTAPESAPLPPRTAAASGTAGAADGSAPAPPGAAACRAPTGFVSVRTVARRGGRVRFVVKRALRRPFDVDLLAQSQGGRVVKNRVVARFPRRRGSFTWSGRAARGLRDGTLLVRFRMRIPGARTDVRRLALRRAGGRYASRPQAAQREGCSLLQVAKLERAVFGGRTGAAARLSVRVGTAAQVTITLARRGRVVRRVFAGAQVPARLVRRAITARGLPRGRYVVTVAAVTAKGVRGGARLGLERE